MALPADFSKIYGSAATGGLTPISDVNYAKGWEFVGSTPPTKNDFSYLQNFSDLKSKWLYSNKLQRTDPFGDIKSDGTVSEALSNLGLPELLAAKASISGASDKKFWVLSAPGDSNAAVPVSLLNAGLDKKANLNGDSNSTFYVSNSGNATAAVNNDRLNFVLGVYAYRGGDAGQGFAVAGGSSPNSAVAYNQFQSGVNGNGAWVKLPGGGQWCRQNLSIPANSTITWTFPAAFGSTPALFFSTFNGAPNVWFNGASASGANMFNANSSAINVNILAIW